MLANLGGIDSKERLWLAAFGGLSLGIAFGLFAFELRSRSLAVAVRRLTDLVVGMDGRYAEHSRESASRELARLSDELMFAAQRAARERRESERRMGSWEALFAAAFDGMFALDAAGRITYINPAAERLFKVKADEATGQLLSDVMLPPTHRSPDNAAFASDLATGKAQGRTQELVAQRSDGRQFPVEVSIAEFGSGETRGFVAIARDISQVRRSRAELKRVRAQAAVAENELREQVAVLKKTRVTPPVVAAADPARVVAPSPVAAHAPAPPARAGDAERIVSFTLEESCGDAIRRLAGRAERLGLGFRYEDGELHGVVLRGDPARLRRVLVSLVDSVVRVTEVGEIIVHLRTAAGEGREIQLTAEVTATAHDRRAGGEDAEALRQCNRDATRRDGLSGPRGSAPAHRLPRHARSRTRSCPAPARPSASSSSSRPTLPASRSTCRRCRPRRRRARCRRHVLPAATRRACIRSFSSPPRGCARNAETAAMMALWAEAHRLKDVWKRHGGRDEIGLVTALAHTARGGDATNAVLLARRLADALEEAARVSNRHAVRA